MRAVKIIFTHNIQGTIPNSQLIIIRDHQWILVHNYCQCSIAHFDQVEGPLPALNCGIQEACLLLFLFLGTSISFSSWTFLINYFTFWQVQILLHKLLWIESCMPKSTIKPNFQKLKIWASAWISVSNLTSSDIHELKHWADFLSVNYVSKTVIICPILYPRMWLHAFKKWAKSVVEGSLFWAAIRVAIK